MTNDQIMGESDKTPIALVIPGLLGLYLLLTSTTDLLPGTDVFNGKRLIQVTLLPAIFVLAIASAPIRQNFTHICHRTPKWIWLCLTFALIMGIASSFVNGNTAYGLADVTLTALLLLAALTIAACRINQGQTFDRLLLLLIALTGLAVAAQETLGFLAGYSAGISFSFDYMLIHFAHPRFYNQFQTWTLPLLAMAPWVFPQNRKLLLGVAIALIALQWCVLLVAAGRGSFLTLTLATLVCGALMFRNRPYWIAILVSGALIGSMMFYGLVRLDQSVFDTAQADSMTQRSVGRDMTTMNGREWLWRTAINASKAQPLLGIGPARYPCLPNKFLPAHPHNQYVQWAAEVGWPATIALLASLVWAALTLLKHIFRSPMAPSPLFQGLSCALLAAAMHTGLSGLLIMPTSQTAAVLVCGWLIGLVSTNTTPPTLKASRNALAIAAVAIALASSFGLANFARTNVGQFDTSRNMDAGRLISVPRFWQEGRICDYLPSHPDN